MTGDFTEKHYTVAELAKLWHLGYNAVRAWFLDEPGVIKFGDGSVRSTLRGKRTKVTLRIPASVAERVYARHTGGNWRQRAS